MSNLDVNIWSTKVEKDNFYANDEMQKVRSEIEKNTSLNLESLWKDFESWVNSEVALSNMRHLMKPDNKKILDELIKLLENKYLSDFDKTMAKNPMYVVQFILQKDLMEKNLWLN